MSSNSTKLRNRWKKVNPEKYQQYLDHQRVKSKERRAEKKKRWESEPHSIDVILQKEREREQTRIRKRRLDDKRRLEAGLPLPNRSNTNQETKKPKDMTPDERRAYYAAQRQLSRARQDPEKKELSRVKCAEYQRRYRERIKLGVQQELPSAENNPSIPTPQTPPSHSHSPSSHNENPSLAVAPAALDADLPCPSQQSQRDTQTTFQHPTKKLVDLNSLLDSVLKNYTENVTEVTQIPELQVDIHPVIDCLPTQENTPKRRRAPSLLQSQTFCDVQVENSDEEFCVRLDLTHYKPEDVKITMDSQQVTVHARHEERQDGFGLVSRQMTRTFNVPKDVDVSSSSSTMNPNGTLSIKMSKIAPETPIEIKIPIEFKT